jgi:hypothetical protein
MVSDDPDKALEELRQRIAREGLPKLSADALRLIKLDRRGHRLRVQSDASGAPKLSDEARRLYQQKNDPEWPWRRS